MSGTSSDADGRPGGGGDVRSSNVSWTTPNNDLPTDLELVVGFFNRGYGSEMGNYIYCDS